MVNHRDNRTSWCNFWSEDFGKYGQFQLTASHICKDDEVNTDSKAGSCQGSATGAYDTGEKYNAARDLDHTNTYVQNAVKAYLKWMRDEMKYDGFRFDDLGGFSRRFDGEILIELLSYEKVGLVVPSLLERGKINRGWKEYGAKTLLWALSFEASSPRSLEARFLSIDLEKERIEIVENQVTKDWREELFLQGLEAEMNNEITSFYYKELKSEWTKIYDMKNHKFYEDFLKNPWNYNFFLDFIEDDPEHDIIVSNLSIKEVGDRQTASTVESINCIFEPTPKNTIIINLDDLPEEIAIQKQWAQINEYNILYFPNELFENLGIGGTKNSAFEYIKSMLHEWVSYNEAITIQCLPIYHLEPNTRIKVEDSDSNIFGEYVISSISIPLDIKGTMSITATRALEKF